MTLELNDKIDSNVLVTVFIGCYNQSPFVEECLEGVLAQNYSNLQVVIFDDCSTDDSVAVIIAWLKRHALNWQFIAHQKNVGICVSLNEVLKLARGDYISMVAADDVWFPDKTSTQVALMEKASEKVGVVYSDAYQIDRGGQLLPKMFIEFHRNFTSMPSGNIHEAILEGNFIPTMTTLIRKKCFQKVGHYDESLFFEDWDMWIRVSREFDFLFSPVISAKYRILDTSMTRARRKDFDEACERMFLKYLRKGWLKAKPKSYALDVLKKKARKAYSEGSLDQHRLLFEAFLRRRSPSCLLMFLFSILRIPFGIYAQGAKWLRIVPGFR